MQKLTPSLINQIQNDLYNALGVNPSNDGVKVHFEPGQNGPMSYCSSFDIYFDFDIIVNFDYDIDHIIGLLSPVIQKYDLTDYWEPGSICSLHVSKDMDPYVQPGFDYDNDPYLNGLSNQTPETPDTQDDPNLKHVNLTPASVQDLDLMESETFSKSKMSFVRARNSNWDICKKSIRDGVVTTFVAGAGIMAYENLTKDKDASVNYKKVTLYAVFAGAIGAGVSYGLRKLF